MVREGQCSCREKAAWWLQVRIWCVGMTCIALLSACFIASSVVHSRCHYVSKDVTKEENENMIKEEKKWSCCPENWMLFGLNCYFISTEEATWEESKKNCEGMQAHLLVINSKEEQDFITGTLNETTHFIGLSRSQDKSHEWQWVDKTPYNTSISSWLPGEPNNVNESCVTLHFRRRKWGWNDVFCDWLHKSICKMMRYSLRKEYSS